MDEPDDVVRIGGLEIPRPLWERGKQLADESGPIDPAAIEEVVRIIDGLPQIQPPRRARRSAS